MSMRRWNTFYFLALALISGCLGFQACHDLTSYGERQPCSRRQAQFFISELKEMAASERLRANKDTSQEAIQAAWLAVKAEYALYRVEHAPKMTDKEYFLLEDTWEMLSKAQELSRLGVREIPEEPGAKLRAYVSPIDKSLQTYSIALPPDYDPDQTYPLLVYLHGHGGNIPYQGHPAPQYKGAICVAPQGRGATDYKGLGELDVMNIIDLMKGQYPIAPDRVYLMGYSMGGTGVLHLGTHFADQFAGLLTISPNTDYLPWTQLWGWNKLFAGRNTLLRTYLQESHTARAYAQNLITLPTYIICGDGDRVVPPEHSRCMARLLKKYKAPVQFRSYLNQGHNGFSKESVQDALAWVASHQRNLYPTAIYWKADSLRYGKAYWTRMEQFQHPLTSAYLYTQLKKGVLSFTTSNLLSFSFQRPHQLFLPTDTMVIQLNGEKIQLSHLPKDENQWITLRKDPIHGWRDARELQVPDLTKKSGQEGPIDEAFLQPFLLVVGTNSPKPEMNEAWAREAMAFSKRWREKFNGNCRLVTDGECTPDMMRQFNVILFGDGRDNMVSEAITERMPVSDMLSNLPIKDRDPQDITESPLDAPDLGYMFVYPNVEFAPRRMAVVFSANSPQAVFQLTSRFGNWFNWGIFDSKLYFDYACFDAKSASPETMLLLGWFGTDWKVETGRFFVGNEALRNTMGRQDYPLYTQVPDKKNTILLTKLMPEKIRQRRGAVGFNRSFHGEKIPIPGCLGVRAPSRIDYAINGAFRRMTAKVALRESYERSNCFIRRMTEEVTFCVYGDNVLLACVSVNWAAPAKDIQVNITGVKKLTLTTQCTAGMPWLHDAALWMAPTLCK